jgi:23S rRNA (cytidine1920-2'-O)/16S rRNA (cytidine1409-2'-O)-methyltransferase
MDVSFISATLVLPAVVDAVRQDMAARVEAVVLVKPQFEAGREHIGKGGIVHDPQAHQLSIDRVRRAMQECGASALSLIDSPIRGGSSGAGNQEFLLYGRF